MNAVSGSQTRPVIYGVWISEKGWLTVARENDQFVDCYADTNRTIVEDTARRFHGEVRYVDETLFRLQAQILEQERIDASERSAIWHIFRTFWNRVNRL